ncbi:MAG: porin [Cellvibrionaceae bacterium]|nr:porin [Cellvibrionaceae bacterium]
MKRTLPFYIALGVAFSSAQPVLANTAGLNFYGRANVSADFLDNGDDSDLNVSSNSSRIGVRASTDLGEGLKGILQVETQINYDNGNGSLASRDTFVGLEGGFGRIRFGQIDTPLKQIRSAVDAFGDQIGDLRNLTRLNGSTGTAFTGQDFDARFRNGIYYNTPSFNGFVFNFHYTPEVKEATDLEDESAAYSTSLAYTAGDLYLALAHEQWESVEDSSAIRLGARYKINNLTLSGLFQQATIKNLPADEDVQVLGVGASYKLSDKWTAKGQVYNLDAKDRDESGATLLAIGADYILSNQFRVLFAYAQTDNEDVAAYRITGGGGYGDAIATVAGETATGLSVGFRYDF